MRAKMKRRSEGKQVDKKRNILRGNISSNFDTVTLWIESTQRQLDIYKEELRQAREEIDKLRSMYMDFYEFAPVGYLTLDRKGRIKGANLMAASLLGIGRSRLLQNALLAYLLKEDWLVFQASLKRIIETPEGQTCEVRVKRKTGDPLWVSVRGERVHGPHGELQEIRLALLDITDRKRLEILEAIRERSQDIPL